MKRTCTILAATVGLLWAAGTARAQSITQTGTGATASADNIVNFTMTVEKAITLTMVGGTDGAATTTLTSTVGNTGTVAFGTVNTLTGSPTTGEQVRATSGTAGATFVATLDGTIDVSGGGTASWGLERNVLAGGVGDVPLANLRYAAGIATAWTSSTAGTQVPDALLSLGNELGASIANGSTNQMQVGVFVPDSFAGSLSTAIIFTATAN